MQLLLGFPSLLPLGIVRLLLLLVAFEVALEVLKGLQVWLVVQVRLFFLCASLCGHKMSAQSGLDVRSSPLLGRECLAWSGCPVAAKLCGGHDPVAHSILPCTSSPMSPCNLVKRSAAVASVLLGERWPFVEAPCKTCCPGGSLGAGAARFSVPMRLC